MPGGGGDPGALNEGTLTMVRSRPPRRWNKGVWIRFALAVTPLVVFAILGYLQTH